MEIGILTRMDEGAVGVAHGIARVQFITPDVFGAFFGEEMFHCLLDFEVDCIGIGVAER